MATNQPESRGAEPRDAPSGDSAQLDPGPRASITGIPGWALFVAPLALVALIVSIGFFVGSVTSIDGGPGFATPSPRAPAPADSKPDAG